MQQVTTSTDRPRGLIDRIASHLHHPGFGRVSGDAGEGDAARLQVEEEEDIIRNETTPGQDFNGEEVCSGKDGMWEAMKSFQLVLWERFGAGAMPWRFRMFPTV